MFLKWHYTEGVKVFLEAWKEFLRTIFQLMSFPILIKTLFSPWKRLKANSSASGFNIKREFDNITYNLTSRIVGFLFRSSLIVAAAILIFSTLFLGLIGFIFWILVPPLSYFIYQNLQKRPNVFASKLGEKILASSQPIKELFDNEAGEYVLNHVGLQIKDMLQSSVRNIGLMPGKQYKGYADVMAHFIQSGVWPPEFFREVGITSGDILLAASIWDEKRLIKTGGYRSFKAQNVKGLGIQLLYGYTPILDKIGVKLSELELGARVLRGREEVLARIDRVLSSGLSVILVGQPGVGKKTLLLFLAKKLDENYKKLVEANIVKLTAEITDRDQRKVAIQSMFSEAKDAGNIVLVIKDLPRLTNREIEGVDYTDLFEENLVDGKLQIIAVATPDEYERFLSRNYRLIKYFEKINVEPLTSEFAMQVLIDKSADLENSQNVIIPIPVLRKIMTTSEDFFSETPFPKKALEILEASAAHAKRTGKKYVTYEDVAQVVSERTGVPMISMDRAHKDKLADIENLMMEKLIGQNRAIKMISQSLRTRATEVGERNKPVGTFLFLGPTGVGKTETAKILSQIYYGHNNIMRFDMAEFVGTEGITKMIGSIQMNRPGVFTTTIRNNPAGLLLLDEIEKASSEIFNVLLTLLDEGYIMDAFGRKIDCRNIFVIATSNAGSELIRQMVFKGAENDSMQREIVDYILKEKIFSTEFLNRFDGVVVYEPLSRTDLEKIAKLKLDELKKRMDEKNINVDFHPDLHLKVAEDGYDPVFGARPMKRVVDIAIADTISQALISDAISSGDRIIIKPGNNKMEYIWEKLG